MGEAGSEDVAAALRAALDGLRAGLRARLREPSVGVDWMAAYESLRVRLQRLGMGERCVEVDEFGADSAALARARPVFDALFDRWWRVDVVGDEVLPRERPCLYVANHAGLLPWDGLMIAHAVERAVPEAGRPRFLVADWLLALPFAQASLARVGGVRACRENAERLLRSGRSVVAFPEGVKGAAKLFRDRYRLQRFGRGGIVRTALAAGVPLVPVAVVGAEETHPVLFKIESAARALRLPFLPVTPTFPALGPLGLIPLPSKWWIGFGEPVDTGSWGAEARHDELLVWRLTEELRTSVQGLVERGLSARGSVFG